MTDLPSRPEVLTPPDRQGGAGDKPDAHRAVTAERRRLPGPRQSIWTARVRPVLKHIGLVLAAFLMLYPLLWMIASSFKPDALIFREPGLIPSEVTGSNYVEGWNALLHPFS